MNNIVLLNGSPRINGSTSMKLLELLQSQLGIDCDTKVLEVAKSINQKTQTLDYEVMAKADAIVIAFPLYVYCLPGVLVEYLSGYSDYRKSIGETLSPKIYAVINCGFPEARINNDAALVVKSFCQEIGAEYRFSVLIGGGGMLQPMKKFPPVHKMWNEIAFAFAGIVLDICDEKNDKKEVSPKGSGKVCENIHIDSKVPKKLFYFIAQTNFFVAAKMKGIKKKEIFRRPYLNMHS